MRKICPMCLAEIKNDSKQWKNKIFCSAKCRKTSFNKEKSEIARLRKKKSALIQNDQMIYVINQCRRAGTVQILSRHTLKSFTKTMDLIKNREKGNVVICHIYPVRGDRAVGLLHYKNLFYGGAYQNRAFGNNYYSGGLSIKRKLLLNKWRVDEKMSNKEILTKIESFLGDIIERYVEKNSVYKSKKIRKIEKILEGDPTQNKDFLLNQSINFLNGMLYELGRGTSFIKHYGIESKYMTYVNELTRFISYGDERRKLLRSIRKIMIIGYMALERVAGSETYNKYFYVKYENLIDHKYGQAMLKNPDSWMVFKDLIYNAAFKVLQGGDLDIKHFKKQVMSYLVFPEKAWKEYGLQYYRCVHFHNV